MTGLPNITEVIQALEQDPALLRMKKLLVYACYKGWENDSYRLNEIALLDLIQILLNDAPTIQQLKEQLIKVASTLNKAAEYTLIANRLLQYLTPLYIEQYSNHNQIGEELCLKITHVLEQDSDAFRIKKLLFAACGNPWENDSVRLSVIATPTLINQLCQLAPNSESLSTVLGSIVQTLNRKQDYIPIAEKIIQAFQISYPSTETTQITQPVSESTQVVEKSIDPPAIEQPIQAVTEIALSPQIGDSDRFDLRLEIMKYTNPLRAKILLFSFAHAPINGTLLELNAAVKSYDLDDLLQQVCDTATTFSNLEQQLSLIAQQLPQSTDYLQAAGAIAKAIKPYYSQAKHHGKKSGFQPDTSTQIKTEIRSSQDDEGTCQFSVAAHDSGEQTAALAHQLAQSLLSKPVDTEAIATNETNSLISPVANTNTKSVEASYQALLTSIRSLFGE